MTYSTWPLQIRIILWSIEDGLSSRENFYDLKEGLNINVVHTQKSIEYDKKGYISELVMRDL